MATGLAFAGTVKAVTSIPGADKIVLAEVVCGRGGVWRGVVQKGVEVCDNCTVYLPDAIVPDTEEFEFMKPRGHRVSMARFKGAPSECLIMPGTPDGSWVGDDLTERLGVVKYEKKISENLMGIALGPFPSFVPRTDESNIQRVPQFLDEMTFKPYYISLKYDGTSCTAYRWQSKFGVCSRNLELVEGNNAYWNVAKKYDLEKNLPDGYAIQFEVYGMGVQKNPVGIKEIDGVWFTAFDIRNRRRLGLNEMMRFSCPMPMVDIVESGMSFEYKLDELIWMADRSAYRTGKSAEGIVVRPHEPFASKDEGEQVSFKVINLGYKG